MASRLMVVTVHVISISLINLAPDHPHCHGIRLVKLACLCSLFDVALC